MRSRPAGAEAPRSRQAPRQGAQKPIVVLGFLGTVLDAGNTVNRWRRWRPSVAVCQHPDLPVARLELLVAPQHEELAAQVIDDIATVSPHTTVVTIPFPLADPWDFEEVYGALHALSRSRHYEGEDLLVQLTTGTHVAQICLFLLTESRHFPGRLLQLSPGEGVGRHAIIDLDLSRYDRIAARFAEERADTRSYLKGGIPTRSGSFNRMIERIEQVAIRSGAPMLLSGPTGAGKSKLARRIFELRRQRSTVEGEFVEVNCATLRGDMAMPALFGHTRGAYTGATAERAGLLKAADGGVLFLDEIGELGLDEQAMLLVAIEEGVYRQVGSDRETKSRFQLIAGTNRDLGRRVSEGRFREDLLARISLWHFRLPGLVDRPEDVEPNLDWELARLAQGGRRVTLNSEARSRFLSFAQSAPWPGNFRELNAAVMRMVTLAPDGRIDVATVEEEILRLRESWSRGGDDGLERLLGAAAVAELDRFDRVQLADVVAVCRRASSLSEAGRLLFAASRARKSSVNDADRLRKYLARFGVEFEQIREQ